MGVVGLRFIEGPTFMAPGGGAVHACISQRETSIDKRWAYMKR